MPRCPRVLLILWLLTATSVSLADSQRDREACENPSTPTAQAIAACTAVADDASLPAQTRASAFARRGALNLYSSKMDLALRDLSRAIELDPSSADYRLSRGGIHSSWRQYAEAIADFTAVLDKHPDDADALSRRSYTYYESGDLDRSIADDTRIIALQPRNAAAFYSRGVSHQDKREYELARADFNRTLELDHNYYDEFERGCVARRADGVLELRDWPRCERDDARVATRDARR